MKFSFSEPGLPKNGAVIVCVGDGSKLSATAKLLDKSSVLTSLNLADNQINTEVHV